jgi:hypothetical protein
VDHVLDRLGHCLDVVGVDEHDQLALVDHAPQGTLDHVYDKLGPYGESACDDLLRHLESKLRRLPGDSVGSLLTLAPDGLECLAQRGDGGSDLVAAGSHALREPSVSSSCELGVEVPLGLRRSAV